MIPNSELPIGDYTYMDSIRMVIEYSGLNYYQVLDLPTDVFLLMRKNYVIEKLRQTEKGQEYLENCERYKITKPDLQALHKNFDM